MSLKQDADFVIIGGGILGAAIASLAGTQGYRVICLRMPDHVTPAADTLRNQGWLQSGVMYGIKEFADEEAFAEFAAATYFAGRQMLQQCGLPLSDEGGILFAKSDHHLELLDRKRSLLNLDVDAFRRLESDEVVARIGEFAEDGAYFTIPDTPFDEAGVLSYLRQSALDAGVRFIEVAEPVTLTQSDGSARIRVGDIDIVTPLAVVAAGAGSFDLIRQAGGALDGVLRRTPLMVAAAPAGMPAPIVVDLDRGFSAVRHRCGTVAGDAVVMGTRARCPEAAFQLPPDRRIPPQEQKEFHDCVPPGFRENAASGRYTAGFEVIPNVTRLLSPYEPWVEMHGAVLFASPGRATVSLMAATKAMAEIVAAVEPASRRVTSPDLSAHPEWSGEISMHYTGPYAFNDAEN